AQFAKATVSPWTGYWQTNMGVLQIDRMLPSHGGRYQLISAIDLITGWPKAFGPQGNDPNAPIYLFSTDSRSDNPISTVLSGTASGAGGGAGHFKFVMKPNPGYPNTPDVFAGRFDINGQVFNIGGRYVGGQLNQFERVIPNSETTPTRRPRPIPAGLS